MKKESNITNYQNYSAQSADRNTYVGYVNGKLTRFILQFIPKTNQVIKVEIA
jgi:hypothetical protein